MRPIVRPQTGPGPVQPELSPYPCPKSWEPIRQAFYDIPIKRIKQVVIRFREQSPKVSKILGVPREEIIGLEPETLFRDFVWVGHPSLKKIYNFILLVECLYYPPTKQYLKVLLKERKLFKCVKKWKKTGPGSYEVIR